MLHAVHYSNWELKAPVSSKGNPRVLVNLVRTSYSKHSKNVFCFDFLPAVLSEYVVAIMLKKKKKNIKNLHSSSVSFVVINIGTAHGVEEPQGWL